MNIWNVVALGIGSMVGAGIFALLGQATLAAGRDVTLAFICAGTVALFSGYSYARLAVRYPSAGGIMVYFEKGFPSAALAGGLSLVYLLTLAASTAMVAKAFGAYASGMFSISTGSALAADMYASVVVVLLAILNMTGSSAAGKAEGLIVAIKLAILSVLMGAGLVNMGFAQLDAQPLVGDMPLFGSIGLTFFAFAGFGMMTNASAEVKNPAKTIPRAIFLAIGLVMLIYVGLTLVVLGNMDAKEISIHADTALAAAARPILGDVGFMIVSVAALFATISAINAMLFSGLRISRAMAAKGQLPAMFGKTLWRQGTWGLMWSVLAILVVANSFNLRDIANVASMTFLTSYLAIFIVSWRLRKQTGAAAWPIVVGFVMMLFVLLSFIFSLLTIQPLAPLLAIFLIIFAIGLEYLFAAQKSRSHTRTQGLS